MTQDPKKRGLGRGLDALFRDVKKEEQSFEPGKVKRADEMVAASQSINAPATPAAPRAPVATAAPAPAAGPRKIAVQNLIPGKFQPRTFFDDSAIEQLAASIAVHGILQPLLVRPLSNGTFEIIAGERRWRAAQKAKVHEVPVVIQDMTDKQALEIALIENLQREDLSAIEEAEGYQRLMDEFSHTQEMLSQQLGKSRSHVANTLRLLKLPNNVRDMVQKGSISAGHARALVGAKDPSELADAIVKRSLSVRETEPLVANTTEGKMKPKRAKGFKQKDVDVLALEQKLTGQLGLTTTIDNKGSAGKLIIEYKTLDQLDLVLKRLLKSA